MTMDFLAFGDLGVDAMARLDHLPQPDEKLWIESYRDFAGGMMGNAAAIAAMLGVRAGVVSLLGHDDRGDFILQELKHKGVETGLIRRIDAPTFLAMALTTPEGERALLQFRTPAFSADWEFDRSILTSTRWVHVSADQGDDVGPLLSDARAAGAATSLDVEYPYVLRDDLDDLLASTSVAFVNGLAAAELGGPEAAVTTCRERGAESAVATLGADGCLVLDPSGTLSALPAHPVSPVDSNGAGDAFGAAFAVGRLAGLDHRDAGEFANLVAALSTTAEGGHGIELDRSSVKATARDAGHGWWEALA